MGAPTRNKHKAPGERAMALGLAALVAVVVVFVLSGNAGMAIDRGIGWKFEVSPFQLVNGLIKGSASWTGVSSTAAIGLVVIVGALLLLAVKVAGKLGTAHTWVDVAASHMATARHMKSVLKDGAAATAERLGVTEGIGTYLGVLVAGGKHVYASFEDMMLTIAGPRTGKTTSWVVPQIVEARGSVITTSNKRDVVDATRGVRDEVGQVWIFDPQGICEQAPDWWWNPLTYVTDEVRAANLAGHFAAGSREAGAKTDAFFDGSGKDLLAGFFLAAATGGKTMNDVYRWLTDPTESEPYDLLKDTVYTQTANQVKGVLTSPEKQRGGVYGTAQQMASCLTNRQVAMWVNPQSQSDPRPHFDPAVFVASGTHTLYSLSKEGTGTAGPLVTALTVAVTEAAEQLAVKQGGRLKTPMLAMLDEAANVCRWSQLPDLYSHYGSRGIVIHTVLQSYSQGVDVWGQSGMKKLMSASNAMIYGGGVRETEFLEMLSQLIGTYHYESRSRSTSKGQSTVSRQTSESRILDVGELTALPKGRAILFTSGNRAAMLRTVPWMAGDHAEEIKSSIAQFDPTAASTIQEAERQLAEQQRNPDLVAA
ncbi:TraM recognition domain-containing protein [Arthrobacter sp. NPDC093128]|uniref:type IV secretory system conjugative DNA transfer family protein n=1 Tax=Arthrobacter sp. NPDC093128 TaxID=3154979 RepID=UPI0034280BB4